MARFFVPTTLSMARVVLATTGQRPLHGRRGTHRFCAGRCLKESENCDCLQGMHRIKVAIFQSSTFLPGLFEFNNFELFFFDVPLSQVFKYVTLSVGVPARAWEHFSSQRFARSTLIA